MGIIEVKNVKQHFFQVNEFVQMIHRVVRRIKKILRNVDNLRDVRIYINAFDPSNHLHQWITSVVDMFNVMFNINPDYQKAIFICIKKGHHILFLGGIQTAS
jgi:hypothetical protein